MTFARGSMQLAIECHELHQQRHSDGLGDIAEAFFNAQDSCRSASKLEGAAPLVHAASEFDVGIKRGERSWIVQGGSPARRHGPPHRTSSGSPANRAIGLCPSGTKLCHRTAIATDFAVSRAPANRAAEVNQCPSRSFLGDLDGRRPGISGK